MFFYHKTIIHDLWSLPTFFSKILKFCPTCLQFFACWKCLQSILFQILFCKEKNKICSAQKVLVLSFRKKDQEVFQYTIKDKSNQVWFAKSKAHIFSLLIFNIITLSFHCNSTYYRKSCKHHQYSNSMYILERHARYRTQTEKVR